VCAANIRTTTDIIEEEVVQMAVANAQDVRADVEDGQGLCKLHRDIAQA
jgi:hypothetical protein